MAAKNKPAGIRSLVYGIDKGKAVIAGLSVSALDQAEHERLLGRFLAVADRQCLINPHGLVADRGDRKAHFCGELVVGLTFNHTPKDEDLALGQLPSCGIPSFCPCPDLGWKA